MTCKECVHFEICELMSAQYGISKIPARLCGHFKSDADVVEVRHGMWKANPDEYEICATEFVCSYCKESFVSSELTDEEFLQMMKYCPNCGAKMYSERSEDTE